MKIVLVVLLTLAGVYAYNHVSHDDVRKANDKLTRAYSAAKKEMWQ